MREMLKFYIDGEWVDPVEPRTLDVINPATEALIAHEVIRNRGTACGSLAHADPAGELTAVLTLLEGSVQVVSHTGEREIGAADLFDGPLQTTLEEHELIVAAPGILSNDTDPDGDPLECCKRWYAEHDIAACDALGATGVRRHDGEVGWKIVPDVFDYFGRGEKVVHRDIKKTLNLTCMKVHGH